MTIYRCSRCGVLQAQESLEGDFAYCAVCKYKSLAPFNLMGNPIAGYHHNINSIKEIQQMTPAEFAPIFDDDVTVTSPPPSNEVVSIERHYCLSQASAKELASLFTTPPEIFDAPPNKQAVGSPFTFNKLVPWLRFANGAERNAGQLAIYWGMPGVPDPMKECEIDINTPVEG